MATPEHILVLTYWGLDDPLIQAYTLPYLRIIRKLLPKGSSIHLVTLERTGRRPGRLLEEDIYQYSFPLHPFGLRAMMATVGILSQLKKIVRDKKITTIHTWCTPAGGLGWRLSRKTGLPLILDSYEPHAEPMVENGTWKPGSLAFRILFFLEKKQTLHAKWLIGVTGTMKEYAREKYGYTGNNFLVKPACIDLEKFSPVLRKDPALLKTLGLEGKIVCVYAGKFGGIYLRDEAFTFFRKGFDHWGDNFRVLLLTSTSQQEIDGLCRNAGVDPACVVRKFVPHSEVPLYLGLGDFAFSAIKPVPGKRYCTPIKNGEFWAMGLPVVIPNGISDDSKLIHEMKAGVVLYSLSDQALAEAVNKMGNMLQADKAGMEEKARSLAVKHRNFKIAEDIYRKIYQE